MITIQLIKKFYSIPQSWNELTEQQLYRLMRLFRNGVKESEAGIRLLCILLNFNWWEIYRMRAEEIQEYFYLVEFLTQPNLTQIPHTNFKGFYSPGSDFNNLLISEFIFTEEYYRQFREQDDQTTLHMLIAILYRPGKKNYDMALDPEGDRREPYNDNLTGHYAAQVSRWPQEVKDMILIWYEGCKDNLQQSNPDIFSSGGEAAQHGLWSVMRNVAEKNIHGNMSQVEKMPVKIFLMELNELLEESRKISQQLTNKSNG